VIAHVKKECGYGNDHHPCDAKYCLEKIFYHLTVSKLKTCTIERWNGKMPSLKR
jgi:hypothetical protein